MLDWLFDIQVPVQALTADGTVLNEADSLHILDHSCLFLLRQICFDELFLDELMTQNLEVKKSNKKHL